MQFPPALLAFFALLALAGPAAAQAPPVSYLHAGATPPGAIGAAQLLKREPLAGYFQPIEIQAPAGAKISLALDNQFTPPEPAPVKAGMLIGAVYRLRVTNIPGFAGAEVFPTIEVVDRLYPPPGLAARFAIPVELSAEELEFALQGKFVTRVIYMEEPKGALPLATGPLQQLVYEVGPHENPVEVADRLGRPMAILRIGGRTPSEQPGADATFMYGSPPMMRFAAPEPIAVPAVAPKGLSSSSPGQRPGSAARF